MKISPILSALAFALFAAVPVHAVDLKLDINQRSATNNVPAKTEGGFTPWAITTPATGVATGSISNSITVGAQTVTITGTGTTTYDDRKRTTPVNNTVPPATFTQQALLQDFIFAVNVTASPSDAGLNVTISGMEAGKEYNITVWSYDNSSGGTRVSDWSVNGAIAVDDYTFDGRVLPTSNEQYQINLNGTADVAGNILIGARRDPTSRDTANAASHGVFLNALWVRDAFEDTDNDGMSDGWETAHNLDTLTNDAALDPDTDGSTNFQEYTSRTDPHDNDSDDDTLLDGMEKKTGNWVSAADTGTNPLSPDSDGDSLGDALENPDLPSTGPAQPGTDPNKYDTDGDTFGDATEINWPISPRDALAFPNPGAGGTLSVDLENTTAVLQPSFVSFPGTTDAAATTSLTATYGTRNVTIAAVGSTTLRSRDRAAAAGGGDFNPLYRDFIYSDTSGDDGDGMDITITGLTPLAAYPVTLWAWDPSSTATPRHSTWLASDGDNPPSIKVPLYSLEGTTLPVSPSDRRMQFTARANSAGELVIQGRKETGYTAATINVFLNAFVIGAPIVDQPPILITGLGPVTPEGMALTWASEAGTTYKVEVSANLGGWTTLSSTITGLAGSTSYTDTTAPAGTTERFYRVSRVP